MAENRRTRLTKKMIRDALIDLLDTRPLEKISVTDVCRRADVNRSTFYAYYEDISALMKDTEDDALAHVPLSKTQPSLSEEDAMMKKLISFLQYIRDNERLFRVLILQADRSSFNQRQIQMVLEQYQPLMTEGLLSQYAYVFCINGVIGLLKEWISGGFAVDTQEFAYMMLDMSLSVFKKS